MFYRYTKFGDSNFSRSGDMIAGIEIENGSCDPDHSTSVQNLTILAYTIPEISFGAPKFKVGHVTLTTPILMVICHQYAGS